MKSCRQKPPSLIGFGCEALGGADWGPCDFKEIGRAIHMALDSGVTLFDTADVYGLGLSERRLGRILGQRRNNLWISTKGGIAWKKHIAGNRAMTWKDGGRRHLTSAVEGSLRRLKIEALPIYFLHWPDPFTCLSESFDTLENLRQKEKIEHIGFSNPNSAQLKIAAHHAKISFVQTRANFLEGINSNLVNTCQELGISIMVYNVLGAGLLTGKFSKDVKFPSSDRRSRLAAFTKNEIQKINKKLENRRRQAERMGISLPQAAIRWALNRPAVTSVILGIKNRQQLYENLSLAVKTNAK